MMICDVELSKNIMPKEWQIKRICICFELEAKPLYDLLINYRTNKVNCKYILQNDKMISFIDYKEKEIEEEIDKIYKCYEEKYAPYFK